MSVALRRLRAALVLSLLWASLMGVVGSLVGVWLTTYDNRYPILPDVSQWWFEWHDTVLRTAGTWLAGLSGLPLVLATALGAAFAGLTVWSAGRGTPPPAGDALDGGSARREALQPDGEGCR